MTGCNTVISIKSRTTYGAKLLDYLALPRSPASREVRSLPQPFLRLTPTSLADKHLELLHTLPGLGGLCLLEELLLMIVLSFYLFGKPSLPKGCEPLDLGVLCAEQGAI